MWQPCLARRAASRVVEFGSEVEQSMITLPARSSGKSSVTMASTSGEPGAHICMTVVLRAISAKEVTSLAPLDRRSSMGARLRWAST